MDVLSKLSLPTKDQVEGLPFEEPTLQLKTLDDWADHLGNVIFIRAEQLPVVTYARAWEVIRKLVKRKVVQLEDDEVVEKLTSLYKEREALLKKTKGIAEFYKAF